MRRRTRFGLAALAVLLVLLGGYTAYWLIVANRIENEITAWARAAHDRKLDASWQKIEVTGFPGGFRIGLHNAALRDRAVSPPPELHIPTLFGVASPWDLADWRLAMPEGLRAGLAGAGGRPQFKLAADTADGALSIGSQDAATLWLNLQQASGEAGDRVRAAGVRSWIILPPKPPQSHTDPSIALAVDLRDVQLPAPVGAFSDSIEELAFSLTLKGPWPSGNLVQSLAAWRDAGGAIALDNLQLKWGGVGASGTGTLTLDRDLQPIGGFSGAIEGYDRILQALVQAGRLRAGDAALAQLALTMLAKEGPDGRPQIATSFTIKNGQMFLGPARLGPVPRIAWE